MTALKDKIAIVSGAGRGTGRALALKLAAAGARVVVNDVSEAPATEFVQTIRDAGGDAVLCVGDITAGDFGDRFVAKALETFGGLDIVINNASYVWPALIDDMMDEQFVAIKFAIPQDRQQSYIQRTALGRSGTPEEAAGAIYLLCLPEADYITGEVILVSGGQLR